MIFGKSTKEMRFLEQVECYNKIFGKRKFAFLPTKLADSRYILFDFYYEYYVGYIKNLQMVEVGMNPLRTVDKSDTHVNLFDSTSDDDSATLIKNRDNCSIFYKRKNAILQYLQNKQKEINDKFKKDYSII